jgi:probable F420-dependent oxidoreductase
MRLGAIGIWSPAFRSEAPEVGDAARELEDLGFGALWLPGGMGGDVFGISSRLLTATGHVVVATGVLNIWAHDPVEVAEAVRGLGATFPDRFLLGLGVSHAPLVEHMGQVYDHPFQAMVDYLDALDRAPSPVAPAERVLAALGPRMLELSRERAAGAHPYLVTPEHTKFARDTLGPGPMLAPEVKVALEPDATKARALARQHLAIYLGLPNYTNNLRRFGMTDADLADGGSDRFVDAVVAWGEPAAVKERVQAHFDAGADHVCIQLLTEEPGIPRQGWRDLAAAVL